MTTAFIRFLNIIIAALLAGTSFGIWIGFNPTNYSPSTYIEQQQHLVLSLNTLMVVLVIMATFISVASAYLQRQSKPVLIMLLLAAAGFASCILITRFGNLPIQTEMLTWKVDSLPDNWKALRDEWWSFHIMRTIAEVVALALVALASTLKRTDR